MVSGPLTFYSAAAAGAHTPPPPQHTNTQTHSHTTWQEHSAVADADVGSFVFNDLAQANEATSSSITSTQQLGELACCEEGQGLRLQYLALCPQWMSCAGTAVFIQPQPQTVCCHPYHSPRHRRPSALSHLSVLQMLPAYPTYRPAPALCW